MEERSKVRIRGIKGRLEEREKDFELLAFLEILREKEKKNQKERWDSKLGNLEFLKQKRKILHSKELTHSKSSLRVKLVAH